MNSVNLPISSRVRLSSAMMRNHFPRRIIIVVSQCLFLRRLDDCRERKIAGELQ